MKMISALAVRKRFGAILDEVVKEKQPIAITRANRPLVVIEPYDTYGARTDQASRRQRLLEVSHRMDEWAERNAKSLRGFDTVKAIRQMRESH